MTSRGLGCGCPPEQVLSQACPCPGPTVGGCGQTTPAGRLLSIVLARGETPLQPCPLPRGGPVCSSAPFLLCCPSAQAGNLPRADERTKGPWASYLEANTVPSSSARWEGRRAVARYQGDYTVTTGSTVALPFERADSEPGAARQASTSTEASPAPALGAAFLRRVCSIHLTQLPLHTSSKCLVHGDSPAGFVGLSWIRDLVLVFTGEGISSAGS